MNSNSDYQNTNFQDDIRPLITDLARTKKVFWFSGDIGVSWSLPLFYNFEQETGITFSAVGIGDTENDSLLQVSVEDNGGVSVVPISLTGRKAAAVSKYGPDFWRDHFEERKPSFYSRLHVMVKHKYFLIGTFLGLAASLLVLVGLWRLRK